MADTIFTNCQVITADENFTETDSVAIQAGRILAVGEADHVSKFKMAGTVELDLKGRTVLPGLIEVHTHPIWTAVHGNVYLDISGMKPMSMEEVWETIGKVVNNTAKGEWVKVCGYNPILIPGMEIPTIQKLDEIAPDNPMCVFTQSLHSCFFNSAAFSVAGIDATVKDPPGGHFVRDSDGQLTGMVNENDAISMVTKSMPRTSTLEGRAYMRRQLWEYAMNGYTTIAATGLFASFKGAYTVIEELTGRRDSPVRLAVYHREPAVRGRLEKMVRGKAGQDNYTFIGVKFWSDGSPYSGTMATQDPYLDNEFTRNGLGFSAYPNHGELNHSEQGLYEAMLPYHLNGLQLTVHAHGERAIEQTLDVYEALLKLHPRDDHRYRLEHCGLITETQLERAMILGATPSFFPDHIHYFGTALRDHILGEERAARFMPLYTASRIGHCWSSHSDSPCCPLGVFRAIKTIVTRASRCHKEKDTESEVIGPEQCVDVTQAIRAYTINPAWQIFHEDYIGSIEEGKMADFTVISDNPLKLDPQQLDEIQILATYRSGKKVNWMNAQM